MADFPAMPFWTDAYISDTQHLTNEEHGIYVRLLIFSWRTSDCCLPNDDKRLATMVGLTPHKWNKIKPAILKFWTVDGDILFQKKQRKVRKDCVHRSQQASKNSKARWEAKSLKTNKVGDTDAMPPQSGRISGRNANQNHNQLKKEEKIYKKNNCKTQWPKNFKPNLDNAKKYWESKNRDDLILIVADIADQFKTDRISKGITYVDWELGWRTWYCNAVKFNKAQTDNEFDKPKVFSAEQIEELMNECK